MQRTTSPDAVSTLPTPLVATSPPGFYNETTNPILATTLTPDAMNSVQEEICNVITNAGITLNVSQTNQLYLAIQAMTAIKVTSPLTIYVSPSGNDSNNGLTSTTPFHTIQAAYQHVANTYNMNDMPLTISLANGTYSAGLTVSGLLLGQGQYTITVQGSNPSLVTVNCPALTNTSTFGAVNGANLTLTGIAINSSGFGQGGFCVVSQNASTVGISNVTFGPAVAGHMIANFNGSIAIQGNYSVTGSAPYHIIAGAGTVQADNGNPIVVTVSGAPHFSVAFCVASASGSIGFSQTTFVGSATGMNYQTTDGGTIGSGGPGTGVFPSGMTASNSTNLTANSGYFQ